MQDANSLTIASRYCGPPDSGNGGYVAGALAGRLSRDGAIPVEVTLRAPPPLERPLSVEGLEGGSGCRLMDGDALLAEARRVEDGTDGLADLAWPGPPPLAEAERMAARYIGHRHHPFPSCFVCGPQRAEGDGLRIFPGRLDEGDGDEGGPVAAVFRPSPGFAVDGLLPMEVLWAALDCPGYFAVQRGGVVALLGRMTAVVHRPVRCDEQLVVTAFEVERQGRKLFAGTALFTPDGEPVARSRQVWITTS